MVTLGFPLVAAQVNVPDAASAGDDSTADAPTTVAPPMPSFLSASRRSISRSSLEPPDPTVASQPIPRMPMEFSASNVHPDDWCCLRIRTRRFGGDYKQGLEDEMVGAETGCQLGLPLAMVHVLVGVVDESGSRCAGRRPCTCTSPYQITSNLSPWRNGELPGPVPTAVNVAVSAPECVAESGR